MKYSLLLFILLSISINAQWVEQTSGVTGNLRSVSVIDQNIVWIAGASGVVLRTVDGGTTWSSVGGGAIGTTSLNFVYGVDANTAIVCGNPTGFGQLYRTTDAGLTWTKVLEQSGGFFNAAIMFSATHGFLTGDPVGGRWSNFKTTNGGATWDSTGMFLAQNGTEAGWNNSIFLMGNKLWYGTDNMRLYYSTNQGASFTAQTMPLQNSFAIWFNSDMRGIVGGSSTGLNSTTDGGTTWTAINSLGTGTIYAVLGKGNVWFHTRGTNIYRSTNDGVSWDTSYTGTGTVYFLQKARNGADVMFAVKGAGGIVKGSNFNVPVELTSFSASAVNDRVVLNWSTATETNNRGFEIQRSANGSDFITVAFVNGAGTTTETQNYSYSDLVSAGKYSYRLKQVDFNGAYEYSNVAEVEFGADLNYALEQNYPNPFNPSTKITYVTKDQGFVSLKIYNILGNEVAELINGEVEAGNHEVTFDASGLSSGVYFYTLTTGNFTATKKMMMMK
jgi:photosystem II stability/assembly factor-like uncharacterized protein